MLKKAAILSFILLLTSPFAKAQTADEMDRDWRIEVDPLPYFLSGYSLLGSKTISEDNAINVGAYVTKFNIPSGYYNRYFSNVATTADVNYFEIGLITRYRFDITDRQSEPYIGITLGYGYSDVIQEASSDIRLQGLSATPHIGYEIYFTPRWYLNPQLRGTLYFAQDSNIPTRNEAVKTFVFTPSIVVGVRL